MDYSYNEQIKRVKPIVGGETEEEYRNVMHKIIEGLTKENLETILFLCKDHIPHGRDIRNPLQLFRYLEDKDLVSQENAVFVAEVLHLVRRMDLLKVIPCIKNKRHFEDEYLACSYCYFSNYRVLTVHLQDELSQRDFETFRFKCASHLRIRSLENADSVLTLLKKLEEEDIVSEDNFEELIKILEGIENVRPLKMFQRLLDGDENVVVPNRNPRRESVPAPQNVPGENAGYPTMHQNSRVEMMPQGHIPSDGVLPPGYYATRHAEPIVANQHTSPKAWLGAHEKVEPVTYEFGRAGPSFSATGRCFHPGGESIPKTVAGGHGDRHYSGHDSEYRSMPVHLHDHLRRQQSEPMSMPPEYRGSPPPRYGMEYEPRSFFFQPHHLPHSSTYPQQLAQLPMHGDQRQAYGQPMQQQYHMHPQQPPVAYQSPYQHDYQPYSYAGQPAHNVHRNISYPSLPERIPEDVLHVERGVQRMRTRDVQEVEVGATAFNQDQTNEKYVDVPQQEPTDRATCSSIMEEPLKKEAEEMSPTQKKQMESLQKRNKELERVIKDQRGEGVYKIDSSPAGMCVLINNVHFKENFNKDEYQRRVEINTTRRESDHLELPRSDLTDRNGSDIDARKLARLFESFDFDVRRHDDCDQRAIRRLVKEYQTMEHWDYDCFVFIVLSHGELGKVFGVCGYPVSIHDIQGAFCIDRCESLANKPKIMIIQACQGSRVMHGHCPEADITADGPKDRLTPNKADFLMAYSTVPGYQSYRSRLEGSHFITELVRIFKTHYEKEDLLSMMIMVNDEMSSYAHKQIPMPVPTLRKKVFFHLKDGWEESDEEDDLGASSSLCSGGATSLAQRAERRVGPGSYPAVFEDKGISQQESGEQDE